MVEISLEKIDTVRDRAGCTYSEAKEALEVCDGDIVSAIVYLEERENDSKNDFFENKDQLLAYIKKIIKKGNVNRIRVKKDQEVLLDIPVNAGIAVTLLTVGNLWIVPVSIVAAVATKVTIEITKSDGTVEEVSKMLKVSESTSSKVEEAASKIKNTFFDITNSVKNKVSKEETKESKSKEGNFTYTVNFEEDNEK